MLGLLTSAQDLTSRGRLRLRRLQMFVNQHIPRAEPRLLLSLPEELIPSLRWWQRPSNVLGGISLKPFLATHHLFVDASLQGWGAHLNDQTAAGQWSEEEAILHINSLEMIAVHNAIQHWAQLLKNAVLMVATDSMTVAAHINLQGGTHSRKLLDLTLRLYDLVDEIH